MRAVNVRIKSAQTAIGKLAYINMYTHLYIHFKFSDNTFYITDMNASFPKNTLIFHMAPNRLLS
jgi:hypothetical protein